MELRWSSLNEKVATVKAAGKRSATVEAIGEGTTTVYASVAGNSAYSVRCDVTVILAPVTGITINSKPGKILDLKDDRTFQLSWVTEPYASNSLVKWRSEDDKVATVTDSGLVQAVAPGSTQIVAYYGDVLAKYDIIVSGVVICNEKDEPLPDKKITVQEGAKQKLKIHCFGNAAPGSGSASWTVREPLYASVSSPGSQVTVTGKSVGETTVTVTVKIGANKTYQDTCSVIVTPNSSAYVYSRVPSGGAFCLGNLIDGGGETSVGNVAKSLKESCDLMLGDDEQILSYISNLSVSPSEGILYYGYRSSADTGMGVGYGEIYYVDKSQVTGARRSLMDVWFVPNPGFGDTATISYTGYDTTGMSYNGGIRIQITAAEDVSYTAGVGEEIFFAADDFNTVCMDKLGRALEYVAFELPAETRGKLVYNIGSANGFTEDVKSGQAFYRDRSYYLDNVSFIPAADFSGVVKIKYRAMDISGGSFTGAVTITVSGSGGGNEGSADDINYATPEETPVKLRLEDFNKRCRDMTNSDLDYVRFTLPDSTKGVLKYTNTKDTSYNTNVLDNIRYYYKGNKDNKPSLANVSFEPAKGFSGTAYIDFEGYSQDGHPFTGTVRILVDNESGGGVINYTSENGMPVDFNPADFNEKCVEINNEVLKWVSFDLPESSQGTLYRSYSSTSSTGTKVSATDQFTRAGSDSYSISELTFVPERGYNGDIMIAFHGRTMNETEINGTVHIYVSGNNEQTIYYNVIKGGVVTFKSTDFNAVSRAYTGENLNYVKFTAPASGNGSLIYNYDWDKETSESVSGNYYYSPTGSQKDLGKVSFKAPANTGTYSVKYSGHTAKSNFDGVINIRVVEPVADTIVYAGTMEPTVMFAKDFENACSKLMGRELDRVVFSTLPDSGTTGRVYRDYTSPSMHGAEVTTGEAYYAGSDRAPALDKLTFIPKAEHGGRVTLKYTGYDSSSRSFTGSVYIDVVNRSTSGKFTDMTNYGWASPSVDFLTGFGIIKGVSSHEYAPSSSITRADYVLMLCRSFRLNTGGESSFSDVSSNSYYAWAVATAEKLGIIPNSGGRFYPDVPITRQDSMVFTQRAMRAAGQSAPDGDGTSLMKFSDAGQVSDYARGAVSMMVDMRMIKGESNKLNPLDNISRAEAAIFLHRVLTR